MTRPSKTEIRSALSARDITGAGADLLVEKFDESWRKVEAAGGVAVVRQACLAKIEAVRLRLG